MYYHEGFPEPLSGVVTVLPLSSCCKDPACHLSFPEVASARVSKQDSVEGCPNSVSLSPPPALRDVCFPKTPPVQRPHWVPQMGSQFPLAPSSHCSGPRGHCEPQVRKAVSPPLCDPWLRSIEGVVACLTLPLSYPFT